MFNMYDIKDLIDRWKKYQRSKLCRRVESVVGDHRRPTLKGVRQNQ
jgi:hypothetical protein